MIGCAFFALQPAPAMAEDIVWNYAIPYTLSTGHGGGGTYFYMSNIMTTIAYHVVAQDTATGGSICGASIPVGTQVRFGFIPHEYSDIYWFGSGAAYDSPYGDWIAGGARPADVCQEKNFAYFQPAWRWTPRNHYISLSVNPPEESVMPPSSLFDCAAPDSAGYIECTAKQAGSDEATFNTGDTYGYFHKALWGDGEEWCYPDRDLEANGSTYQLQVPAQHYSCPITVAAGQGGAAPSLPVFTSTGTDACTIGTPFSLSFSSSDPSGARVRYGIDWNNDGTIDQVTPYVASGAVQTVSRAFAVTGTKVIRVRAFSERGTASGYARRTIQCAGATTNDSATAILGENAGGARAGSGAAYESPDLTLRVVPSLVRKGSTSKVSWSAMHVLSCDVTAPNGDAWDTIESVLGGNVSQPITQQTVYTLACLDLRGALMKKTAVINILPDWQEQ